MRSIIPVFMLVLTFSCVQAYPLQGGNGEANCTLFGWFKTPILGDDPNATVKEYVLFVDVALTRASNATYELVDDQDKTSHPDYGRSRVLQPGRQLLAFVVPKGALFKLFKVRPFEGEPFSINWWKTPKAISGDITLRYYGIVGFAADPNEQSLAMEMTLENRGKTRVPISPENFTLIDQWGWPYYTLEGFRESYLEPDKTTMVIVNFTSLSPLSRPALLLFDYPPNNQIAMDLEKDTGPLSDEIVYGTEAPVSKSSSAESQIAALPPTANNTSNNSSQQQASKDWKQSLKKDINATKARLSDIKKPGSGADGQGSSIGSQIKTSVDEARARLEEMKKGLKNGTKSSET